MLKMSFWDTSLDMNVLYSAHLSIMLISYLLFPVMFLRAFKRNQWPIWHGIAGRFGAESPNMLACTLSQQGISCQVIQPFIPNCATAIAEKMTWTVTYSTYESVPVVNEIF